MKNIIIGVLSLFVATASYAGGISGGGGNVTPGERITQGAALEYVHYSIFLIRPIMIGLQNDREGKEIALYDKIIFDGNKKLWDVYGSASIDYKFDEPCVDIDGQPSDASADVVKNQICLSLSRLSDKLTHKNAMPEIMALVMHEYAHLVGANENQAASFQREILDISQKYIPFLYSYGLGLPFNSLTIEYYRDVNSRYLECQPQGLLNQSIECAFNFLKDNNLNEMISIQDFILISENKISAMNRIKHLLNLTNWSKDELLKENKNFKNNHLYGSFLSKKNNVYIEQKLLEVENEIAKNIFDRKKIIDIFKQLSSITYFVVENLTAEPIKTAQNQITFSLDDYIFNLKNFNFLKSLTGQYKVKNIPFCEITSFVDAAKLKIKFNNGKYSLDLLTPHDQNITTSGFYMDSHDYKIISPTKFIQSYASYADGGGLYDENNFFSIEQEGVEVEKLKNNNLKLIFFERQSKVSVEYKASKNKLKYCEFSFEKIVQ